MKNILIRKENEQITRRNKIVFTLYRYRKKLREKLKTVRGHEDQELSSCIKKVSSNLVSTGTETLVPRAREQGWVCANVTIPN